MQIKNEILLKKYKNEYSQTGLGREILAKVDSLNQHLDIETTKCKEDNILKEDNLEQLISNEKNLFVRFNVFIIMYRCYGFKEDNNKLLQ